MNTDSGFFFFFFPYWEIAAVKAIIAKATPGTKIVTLCELGDNLVSQQV